ncbi:unnamed protein product [Heligmosomoides polygyrus]|uniref:Uncharacterized protein n=1 Tax=Heligmosomoides polygyrus TaxID=6339 RepID=A0A183FXI1_HELPZ|nr:unnamed protein product [Heligmosomoides polygyrus]
MGGQRRIVGVTLVPRTLRLGIIRDTESMVMSLIRVSPGSVTLTDRYTVEWKEEEKNKNDGSGSERFSSLCLTRNSRSQAFSYDSLRVVQT